MPKIATIHALQQTIHALQHGQKRPRLESGFPPSPSWEAGDCSHSPPMAHRDIVIAFGHYNDAIMSTIASQITSLTIVYSGVYSGWEQRKHQSSALLAFVRGIHQWPIDNRLYDHCQKLTINIYSLKIYQICCFRTCFNPIYNHIRPSMFKCKQLFDSMYGKTV